MMQTSCLRFSLLSGHCPGSFRDHNVRHYAVDVDPTHVIPVTGTSEFEFLTRTVLE